MSNVNTVWQILVSFLEQIFISEKSLDGIPNQIAEFENQSPEASTYS